MRWEFGRRSDNVEDQRGSRVSGPIVGGGIGALLLAAVVALLGGDPSAILQGTSTGDSTAPATRTSPEEDRMKDFVSVVLADTEDTWNEIFRQGGAVYEEPKLVLFSGSVNSACGYAQAAMGPFYCPRDRKVYIDLSFYDDLKNKLNAPGDFAQAYVIAHEVGHHVQNLLGTSGKVQRLQQRVGEAQSNQLSVKLELQADCYAGIWAHNAQRSRQILEQGDIEEALNAASQIGDDRLQAQSRGYVVPDSFTHGSSEQRVRWFAQGLKYGSLEKCDTFSVRNP